MDKKESQNKFGKLQSIAMPLQEKAQGFSGVIKEKFKNELLVIGIDIGISSVKAVQLVNINGELTIVKSSFVNIEGDSTNEAVVVSTLQKALVGFDTKNAKVVALINCPQTCTRRIVTPNMPKKELAEAIRWEAKNAIPFSIDKALMDYEIVGEMSDKGIRKLVVAVAAASRETVDQLVSILSKLDLDLSAFIPISVSAQNLIKQSRDSQQMNIAVVEMGAAITELNIYQKGKLAFSRKLPIAGNDITKSLTSTLMTAQGKIELSIAQAEVIKKEHGIPSPEDKQEIDGKILPNHILSLVRPSVEQLANEIERSFDFYREESHGEKVDKIILFGGGSNLKRLVALLRDELEITIEIGDALNDIKILKGVKHTVEMPGSRLNLAIGAVLNRKGKINLLPIELKEKRKRFVENMSLQIIFVSVIMTMLLSFIGLKIQLAAQHKRMTTLQLEQKTLVPQLESIRSVMMADRILSGHPYWEDVLIEISNRIEPKIYLTKLSMEDDVVNLQGVILKSNQKSQTELSNFMITLEEGIFRHVSLVTSKKETQNATFSEFEIEAEVE